MRASANACVLAVGNDPAQDRTGRDFCLYRWLPVPLPARVPAEVPAQNDYR